MHGIDTPHDLGDAIQNDEIYWSDDVEKPEVENHPSGQTYLELEGKSAEAVVYCLRRIDQAGLRANVSSRKSSIGVFLPRETCDHEECYADEQGGSRAEFPGYCPAHAREKKEERRKAGLPPQNHR